MRNLREDAAALRCTAAGREKARSLADIVWYTLLHSRFVLLPCKRLGRVSG